MAVRWKHTIGMLAVLAAAGPALSQVGHPVKGSWSGYWGPSRDDRTRMLLVLDWEDNEIVGTINPGPNAVPIERAELDLSTWTLTLEAKMPVGTGGHRAATWPPASSRTSVPGSTVVTRARTDTATRTAHFRSR